MQRKGIFITITEPNEIFVFGSNDDGRHVGGAAKYALDHYGAKMGQGHGIQGQSYAIDTMSGYTQMAKEIRRFLGFAEIHNDLIFIVTPIGCGIAGYLPKEIIPLFEGATENVILPEEFKCQPSTYALQSAPCCSLPCAL